MFSTSCASNNEFKIEGVHHSEMEIVSYPTDAKIMINDKLIGETPLTIDLWAKNDNDIKIIAIPIYENQWIQEIVINAPPIPDKINIQMDIDTDLKSFDDIKNSVKINIPDDTVYVSKFLSRCFNSIYFDKDKYVINENDTTKIIELNKVINYIKLRTKKISRMNNSDNEIKSRIKNSFKLEIIGYSDIQGDTKYNQILSLNRANSVYNYLVKNGINKDFLTVKGGGESNMFYKDGVIVDYSLIRRVDFKIIDNTIANR